MNKKEKEKIVNEWINKNGAAEFDLKNRNIILYDGGLFSMENLPKIKAWTKYKKGKPEKITLNGKESTVYPINFIPRKYKGKVDPNKVFNFIKNKINKKNTFEEEVLHFFSMEKMDYISAIIWFEELDETINYLKRMKKMLNKIGYKTDTSIINKKSIISKLK